MIFKHKDKTVKKLLYSKQVDPHSVLIEKKGIEYKNVKNDVPFHNMDMEFEDRN